MITTRSIPCVRPVLVSGNGIPDHNAEMALLYDGYEGYDSGNPCAPVFVTAQCAGWALAILFQRCGWRFAPHDVQGTGTQVPYVRRLYPEWGVDSNGRRRITAVLAECWNDLVVDVVANACPGVTSERQKTALLDLFGLCFTSRLSDDFLTVMRTLMARRAYILDTYASYFTDWGVPTGTSHPILNGVGAPIATIALTGTFPGYYPDFFTSLARENSSHQLVDVSNFPPSPHNAMNTEEVTPAYLVTGLQALLSRAAPSLDRYAHNALKNACARIGGSSGFFVDETAPRPNSDVRAQQGSDLANKSKTAVAWQLMVYQHTSQSAPATRPIAGYYAELAMPASYPFGVACSYVAVLRDDQDTQISQQVLDTIEILRDRVGLPLPTVTLSQMVEMVMNRTAQTLTKIGEPAESSDLVTMINAISTQMPQVDLDALVSAVNSVTIKAAQALTVAVAEAVMPPDRWLPPGDRQAALAKSLQLNYPEIFDAEYSIFPDKEVRDDEPS